jgi:hypothetical protein
LEEFDIDVFASDGKLVQSLHGNNDQLNNQLNTRIGSLENGIYWLNCKSATESVMVKFIVLH